MRLTAAKKRRKGGGGGMPDVPTDSFSDIAFLLIIFFMIATTLNKISAFDATVPSSKRGPSSSEQAPTVHLAGVKILFNGTEVTMAKLKQELADRKLAEKAEDARFVMLEAEPSTKYELYYAAWAAIVKAGGNVALLEREDR